MGLLQTLAKTVGTAYDYLTPGLGSSRLTDYGTGANKAPASSGGVTIPNYDPNASGSNDANNALLQSLLSKMNSLSAPPAVPLAPYFDITTNFSKAQQAATAAVNPLYTKKLNDFITGQQTAAARQQADTTTANTQLQESLDAALAASNTNRERTTQDTATNVDAINKTQGYYQTDQGNNFEAARAALAGNIANSGLTGSGLGSGQTTAATKDRNVTEGRQVESFNTQKAAQQLAKTRTFEDLLTSDTLNTKSSAEKTSANNLDLDRFISDQGTALSLQRDALAAQQEADITAKSNDLAKQGFAQFLATLKNPGDIQRASAAYGGLF